MQEKKQHFSPIKQRILYFADTLNISKREFYKKISVSRGTLESSTGITEDIMAKFIATYPEVSPEWLVLGNGPMLRTEPKKTTPGVCPAPGKCDQLEKDIKKLTQDLSKKCMDLTTALTDQQNKLTEIIASQQRLIEALTHKK